MGNMDKLKDAFNEVIQREPGYWNDPIVDEPGAPSRKKVVEDMFFPDEDYDLIEHIVNTRVDDGETIQDIVDQMVQELDQV